MDVPRALSILHSIHRAITAYSGHIPNIEFSFCLSDWPNDFEHRYPLWVLTRHINEDGEKWVMPDFGYWSWPGPFMGEYSKLRSEIAENEPDSWEQKKPQAVWRGATTTNDLRNKLVEVTKGKKWADVKAIFWDNKDNLEKDGITVPEHCNYQYVLHTEGKLPL
jgi:Glycosyl transferase family 90